MKRALLSLLLVSAFACSKNAPEPTTPANEIEKPVACTEEAKVCPDGSNVVREGPNCEFAACPGEGSPGDDGSAPDPVACTQEAKQCPDGSYVSRTGPNCEFAPCPG